MQTCPFDAGKTNACPKCGASAARGIKGRLVQREYGAEAMAEWIDETVVTVVRCPACDCVLDRTAEKPLRTFI